MPGKGNFELFDAIDSGILVIDSDFTIVFWNSILESLSGIKRTDIEGKNLLQEFEHLNTNIFRMRIGMVLKNGIPHVFSSQLNRYIVPCRLYDGAFRLQDVTVSRFINRESREVFGIFSIHDVTDINEQIYRYKEMRDNALEQVNERIKAEERLRASTNAKEKLFSVVSHDLKSPVAALLGYSRIMHEDFFELTQDQLQEFVGSVMKMAESINDLITNLLDYTRMEQGLLSLNRAKVSVPVMMSHIYELLNPVAEQKTISIKLDCPEELYIYADENMVEIAIRNLISNAIKFSFRGSTIEIAWKRTDTSVEGMITDHGIGIEPDRLRNLFKADKNSATRGTEQERGTGLGLLLCKELVEKNQGKISVSSTPKIGSTFSVSFPAID
ncbi:MAG: ATP-binding protein [Ignavibacteria bacterium]|nr:ATP-binding protein [Ignavibacteria bacterium]